MKHSSRRFQSINSVLLAASDAGSARSPRSRRWAPGKAWIIVTALLVPACATSRAPNLPLLPTTSQSGSDSGEGWFYPLPNHTECHVALTPPLPEVGPGHRLRFVDQLNIAASENRKGGVAQAVDANRSTIVFTMLGETTIESDYQARAVLAEMTTVARQAPILVESGFSPLFEAPDFVALLGFKRLIVSNGIDYAYQIVIEQDAAAFESSIDSSFPC